MNPWFVPTLARGPFHRHHHPFSASPSCTIGASGSQGPSWPGRSRPHSQGCIPVSTLVVCRSSSPRTLEAFPLWLTMNEGCPLARTLCRPVFLFLCGARTPSMGTREGTLSSCDTAALSPAPPAVVLFCFQDSIWCCHPSTSLHVWWWLAVLCICSSLRPHGVERSHGFFKTIPCLRDVPRVLCPFLNWWFVFCSWQEPFISLRLMPSASLA